jgi:hypothetical protein
MEYLLDCRVLWTVCVLLLFAAAIVAAIYLPDDDDDGQGDPGHRY